MPVGPYILCTEKVRKSQPMSCTSTRRWGTLCAPSTSTFVPWAWAMAVISFTGFTVPSTLLTWAMQTSRVRGENRFLYASRSISPSSVIGITLRTMPFRSRSICQGTMLEWCSITLTSTSSPSLRNASPKEKATRLRLSVVPRVKIISASLRALIKCCTLPRACSWSSVACCER